MKTNPIIQLSHPAAFGADSSVLATAADDPNHSDVVWNWILPDTNLARVAGRRRDLEPIGFPGDATHASTAVEPPRAAPLTTPRAGPDLEPEIERAPRSFSPASPEEKDNAEGGGDG